MTLHEELYFEITVEGAIENVKKFVSYATSGELDEFFEITGDYVAYDDDSTPESTRATISNDDIGIEIDSLRIEEFLDALCSGGRQVLIYGHIYDIDDEEYRFISHIGNAGFINAKNIDFADELDIEARREESEEDNDF